MSEEMGLAQAIQSLRKEITDAVEQAEGESTRFEIKDIELELSVVASSSVTGAGGAEAEVSAWKIFTGKLNTGIEVSGSDQAVHKVKLSLGAKFYDDGGKEVDRAVSKSIPTRPIDSNRG